MWYKSSLLRTSGSSNVSPCLCQFPCLLRPLSVARVPLSSPPNHQSAHCPSMASHPILVLQPPTYMLVPCPLPSHPATQVVLAMSHMYLTMLLRKLIHHRLPNALNHSTAASPPLCHALLLYQVCKLDASNEHGTASAD